MPNQEPSIPIHLPWKLGYNQLGQIFDRSRLTNSYKLFWFWALLDLSIRTDDFIFSFEDLAIEMLVKVWYPVHYFKLDFGSQDMLVKHLNSIHGAEGLSDEISEEELRDRLKHVDRSNQVDAAIKALCKYVPYRFLSPWAGNSLKGLKDHQKNAEIQRLADASWRDPQKAFMYRFVDSPSKGIWLRSDWLDYLREHYSILKEYTLYHLASFIQGRNPNIPNIINKLEYKPAERDQLTARKLWQPFLELHPETRCIYTGQAINKFAIDHFLPWSFVAHNDIWNTVPIPERVNSAKGNMLPLVGRDLDNFVCIQYRFHQFLNESQFGANGKSKAQKFALEQYALLFRTDSSYLSRPIFETGLRDRIMPLITVARFQQFRDWER